MADGFEILDKSELYRGFFRLVQYRFRHRLFAGGWSGEVRRELCERARAVGVLPYDPVADAVVLIEQFRIGALAGGMNAWQAEIVAGFVEEHEAEEEVAHRESQEEASLALSALLPICRYAVSPGSSSETVALFCGRVDSRGAGGIHGLPEEHEDIRATVLPFAGAMRWLEEGRVENAISIIALQWLALHREAVRKAWA